jgi:hypothetical protein
MKYFYLFILGLSLSAWAQHGPDRSIPKSGLVKSACDAELKTFAHKMGIATEGCSRKDGIQKVIDYECMQSARGTIQLQQSESAFAKNLCAQMPVIHSNHTPVSQKQLEANCYINAQSLFSPDSAYFRAIENCRPKPSGFISKWVHDSLDCLKDELVKVE